MDRLFIQRKKLRDEIESARIIKERNYNPIDILDDLIENMMEFMKMGILEKNPDFTQEEIIKEMHRLSLLPNKISRRNICR